MAFQFTPPIIGGIITFTLLIATLLTGALPRFTKLRIPVKWHIGLATATLVFALIHATAVIILYS